MDVRIIEVMIYLLRQDRSNIGESLLQTLHRGTGSCVPGVLIFDYGEWELRDRLELVDYELAICW